MDEAPVFRVGRGDRDYQRSLSGLYTRPYRGVRIVAAVDADPRMWWDAALALAPAGAALSGRTAAQLWRLPLPRRYRGCADRRPQLMVPALPGGPTVDVAGIECRLCILPTWQVTTWEGRAVTTPARTYLDLAAVLDLPDLVAVGDVILLRRLASRDDLERVVGWAQRRRGVVRARRALPLLDRRARSPQESRLRALLLLADLPAPEPNAVIYDDHGGFLAEGDLVWRPYRLMVEYDGVVHLDDWQRRKDAVRRNMLLMADWIVLVYTGDVLSQRPGRIVSDVVGALQARGWRGTPT